MRLGLRCGAGAARCGWGSVDNAATAAFLSHTHTQRRADGKMTVKNFRFSVSVSTLRGRDTRARQAATAHSHLLIASPRGSVPTFYRHIASQSSSSLIPRPHAPMSRSSGAKETEANRLSQITLPHCILRCHLSACPKHPPIVIPLFQSPQTPPLAPTLILTSFLNHVTTFYKTLASRFSCSHTSHNTHHLLAHCRHRHSLLIKSH